MTPWSMATEGCCVRRHENDVNLVARLHQSSWGTRSTVSEQQCFERNLFWADLNSKPCCKQMFSHPGFVVASQRHRQSRFRKGLQGPRVLERYRNISPHLQPPAALAPERVSCCLWSFEAGHWLLSSHWSPGRHLLPLLGCVVCAENLVTFMTFLI